MIPNDFPLISMEEDNSTDIISEELKISSVEEEQKQQSSSNLTSNNDENEGERRSRGRPRKIIDTSEQQCYEMIEKYLVSEMTQIEEETRISSTDRKRVDTLRTRLVRLLKKVPQELLTYLNAKGDYKSPFASKYVEAYRKTFNMAVRAFHYGSFHSTPQSFDGFVTLYFPDEKALDSCADKINAQKMIDLKAGTSVKKVRQLAELNPWVGFLIEIALKIISDKNLQVPNSFEILKGLEVAIKSAN